MNLLKTFTSTGNSVRKTEEERKAKKRVLTGKRKCAAKRPLHILVFMNDRMDYTPVTPYRRAIDAYFLKHQAATQEKLPPAGANKWEVLWVLAAVRVVFGLSDPDPTVLQALVSLHQATILGGNDSELIVYPSIKAICERLNRVPCFTSRHLFNLVQTGFVVWHDSPNGKRFSCRYADEKVAFGFDLSTLVDAPGAKEALIDFDYPKEGASRLAGDEDRFSQAAVDPVHRIAVYAADLRGLKRRPIRREALRDGTNLGRGKFRTFRVSVFHGHTALCAFLSYALLGKTLQIKTFITLNLG